MCALHGLLFQRNEHNSSKTTHRFLFFLHSSRHLRYCTVDGTVFTQIRQFSGPIDWKSLVGIKLSSSKWQLTHLGAYRVSKAALKSWNLQHCTKRAGLSDFRSHHYGNYSTAFCGHRMAKTSYKTNLNQFSFWDPIFSDPSWRQNSLTKNNPIVHHGDCAWQVSFGCGVWSQTRRKIRRTCRQGRAVTFSFLETFIHC